VGLERGPLNLVSTIEELLEWKSNGSGLEIWEYGRRNPSRWPRGTLCPQKLALTSQTSSGRSAGIGHSRIQATEFFIIIYCTMMNAIERNRESGRDPNPVPYECKSGDFVGCEIGCDLALPLTGQALSPQGI
jgi:hypothetical protein